MKQHKLYVGLILVTFLYFDSEVIQLVIDLKRKAEINRFSSHHARLVKKRSHFVATWLASLRRPDKIRWSIRTTCQCPIMGEHKIQDWDNSAMEEYNLENWANSAIGEYTLHGDKFYQ